jgi:hypothetical protein
LIVDKLVHEASELIKMVSENQVYLLRGFLFVTHVRTFVRTSDRTIDKLCEYPIILFK